MKRTAFKTALSAFVLTAVIGTQATTAQDFELDENGLPVAPEVVPPGWPPPADLCALEDDFDFAKERRNPGLQTADQYRRWAITGFDRDNPNHLYFLGLMHEYGRGVIKDQRRADRLFRQAADQGITDANVRLGRSYCRREHYCIAAQAFDHAALRDNPAGQMMLSRLYRWGLGVYYNPVEAYKWGYLSLEKTDGNWLVNDFSGVIYLRELERIITDNEVVEAEERIDDWKRGFNIRPIECRVEE